MKKFKILVRSYKTKDGREFAVAKCSGKYIPLVELELDKVYTVKFTQKCGVAMPIKDGVYSISFKDDGVWLDHRDKDNPAVFVNVERIQFEKDFKKD